MSYLRDERPQRVDVTQKEKIKNTKDRDTYLS